MGLDAPVAGKGGMSYKEKQEAELAANEGPKIYTCHAVAMVFHDPLGNFISRWTIRIQRYSKVNEVISPSRI